MAAPADQRIAVPIDDPNADTEWNEILRKHGIIPEKPPSPTPIIEEAILENRRLAHENRLVGKDLDELDELEDIEEEGILNEYRQRRLKELMSLAKKSVHGSVYKISADEYLKEVNEASKTGPVFLHLTSSTTINDASKRLSELWREAAKEYGEIKFCEMQDRQLPEQMTPTILVYKDDEIVKRIVTLDTMGGMRVNMRHIDDLLVEVGAVQDTDMRVLKRRQQAREAEEEGYREGRTSIRTGVTSKRSKVDDDDDDWD